MREKLTPYAIIGFGGHGRVCYAALAANACNVALATSLGPAIQQGMRVTTDEELVRLYSVNEILLCLGIGSTGVTDSNSPRIRAVQKFAALGYTFMGFIHPSAWVAPSATVAPTAQIHAGAIVQPNAAIHDHAIVNTRATIEHDCRIGEYSHVAPGATLCGSVIVGANSHIGPNATIIPSVTVGHSAFVAAGATVVRDVAPHTAVRGTPANAYLPE